MKLPLALTGIILASGLFWGAREHAAREVLRERHRQVSEQAAALGVSTDSSHALAHTKAAKRQREDATRKVKDFADKLVAFAKEMKELEKNGGDKDPETQKRVMDTLDGLLSLKGDELKLLIEQLKARTDLDDDLRKEILGFSVMMLAQKNPQAALSLFTESSDLLEGNHLSEVILRTALNQWAADQPLEAAEWIGKNAEKYPKLVTDEAREAVISGAARSDFGLAFKLAAELKLKDGSSSMIHNIARTADTPERQTDFLAAIRKQAQSITDSNEADHFRQTGISALFSQVADAGYDKSMEWIQHANLTSKEMDDLVSSIGYYETRKDTGKWLDWLGSQSAETQHDQSKTSELVRNWTRQDYKAAGEWLAKSPAGPMRETATLSYLETVAPYDPDVAVQWAGTLPANQQADAMKRIHEALQQKDKAAAEDFAKRHGIGEK